MQPNIGTDWLRSVFKVGLVAVIGAGLVGCESEAPSTPSEKGDETKAKSALSPPESPETKSREPSSSSDKQGLVDQASAGKPTGQNGPPSRADRAASPESDGPETENDEHSGETRNRGAGPGEAAASGNDAQKRKSAKNKAPPKQQSAPESDKDNREPVKHVHRDVQLQADGKDAKWRSEFPQSSENVRSLSEKFSDEEIDQFLEVSIRVAEFLRERDVEQWPPETPAVDFARAFNQKLAQYLEDVGLSRAKYDEMASVLKHNRIAEKNFHQKLNSTLRKRGRKQLLQFANELGR